MILKPYIVQWSSFIQISDPLFHKLSLQTFELHWKINLIIHFGDIFFSSRLMIQLGRPLINWYIFMRALVMKLLRGSIFSTSINITFTEMMFYEFTFFLDLFFIVLMQRRYLIYYKWMAGFRFFYFKLKSHVIIKKKCKWRLAFMSIKRKSIKNRFFFLPVGASLMGFYYSWRKW